MTTSTHPMPVKQTVETQEGSLMKSISRFRLEDDQTSFIEMKLTGGNRRECVSLLETKFFPGVGGCGRRRCGGEVRSVHTCPWTFDFCYQWRKDKKERVLLYLSPDLKFIHGNIVLCVSFP